MMYLVVVWEQEDGTFYCLKPLSAEFHLPSNAKVTQVSLYINTTTKLEPMLGDLTFLCSLSNRTDLSHWSVFP
jgi:hypothetical protein